jgi:lysophospholipase L1-like esterase
MAIRTPCTSLLLVVFGVSVSLLIGDLTIRGMNLSPTVFRLATSDQGSVYQLSDNPVLGYEIKPDFRSATTQCHHAFPFTNKWGQRDIERSRAHPDTTRVIILGDSVVAGSGVCNLQDTIPARLEQLLAPAGFDVLNFGVGGYCTRAEVELLRTKGIQFTPDIVLLMFVYNDVVNANSDIINRLGRKRPRVFETLFVHSALFRLLALRTDLLDVRSEMDQKALSARAIQDDNVKQGLTLLRELQSAHGFRALILLWPYFTDRSIAEPVANPDEYLAEGEIYIERLAREFGLETMRLSTSFQNDLDERRHKAGKQRRISPRWIYTVGDGTHPSAIGAGIVATALAPKVLQMGQSAPLNKSPY